MLPPPCAAITRISCFMPEQRAEHIGVEHGRIALGCLLGDRTGMALGAGIVDCHIEPAEALDGLIDQARASPRHGARRRR